MESHYELLKLFLPELLVDYFDLTKSKKEGDLLHLFFEEQNKWTKDQKKRAVLLLKFIQISKLHINYYNNLPGFFETTKEKIYGYTRLAKWHEKVMMSGFKSFNTISRTIIIHYKTILNYFENRSTNASAESFNAKIKAFRSQFRGVRNVEFFLYRLTQIYA